MKMLSDLLIGHNWPINGHGKFFFYQLLSSVAMFTLKKSVISYWFLKNWFQVKLVKFGRAKDKKVFCTGNFGRRLKAAFV